jgi:hypothetical protein
MKLEHGCPPGHSGGGVFDQQWRLVGMIFDNQVPYCRALKIESVVTILNDWKLDVQLRRAIQKEAAPTAKKRITVAVVDFDNRSGERLPDIGPAANDIVTSFLHGMNFRLVTRDRIQSVLREQNLDPTQLSTRGISRFGKLVDADVVVTGSVTRYDVERRTFKGYGTSILSDTYRIGAHLQVIDINTGEIFFSRGFGLEAKKSYPDAASAPRRPTSRESELLATLLKEKARGDLTSALQQIAGGGRAGELILVPVHSLPSGAEVVVAGIYRGKTPTELDLSPGVHEIEIRRRGYALWRHKVIVEPGFRIEATLSSAR